MAKKLTQEEFIEKAKEKHGDKYDYSKVKYVNTNTPVTIICRKHGEFDVRPADFIRSKYGSCHQCKNERLRDERSMGKDRFIKKSKTIHGDGYNYDEVVYVNNRTKVILTCPNGHRIEQTPDNHFKYGCYKCAHTYQPTTEEFIEKARKIHGSKYDYSETVYINSHSDITVICPKHGPFTQTATDHLSGKGCQLCNSSRLEEKLRGKFEEHGLNFLEQAKFDWLKNDKTGKEMSFDFYFPDNKIAIECQGVQHFKPVDFFGGDNNLNETVYRDNLKLKLAKKHGIKLLYFAKEKYRGDVFTNENELLDFILKND